MSIDKIQIFNFRNYQNLFFDFSKKINCIVGSNGSGKTNLLDAIYFLALTKSALSHQDHTVIRFKEEYTEILGILDHGETIRATLKRGLKKQFFADDQPYTRLKDHIGKVLVVMITPDDIEIINGGAEIRRRFFDGLLGQIDPVYLNCFQEYNRLLEQRNALLKKTAELGSFDRTLFDIFDERALALNQKIFEKRAIFTSEFLPIFYSFFQKITESVELPEVVYESGLKQVDFEKQFLTNIRNDIQAQRTLLGVHEDEFLFYMDQNLVKQFGSQGQKKSYLLALKLAQFEIMYQKTGKKPLLLLDDVFDKLDEMRIRHLIELIQADQFGQIFLTDARPERTQTLLKELDFKLISLT